MLFVENTLGGLTDAFIRAKFVARSVEFIFPRTWLSYAVGSPVYTVAARSASRNRLPGSRRAPHAQKKKPYFIGIGANDGVTHDPLFPFIRDCGWGGIMVEPLPQPFAALKKNYSNFGDVDLVQAAIGKSDGTGVIYTVDISAENSMMMSLHSSFNREVLLAGRRWHRDLEDHIVTENVPVMSFKTLLAKANGHAIDVLKIDTEGYDLEILKTVDFSRISPSLILVEHANISRNDKIAMADILLNQGYRVGMTSLDMLGYKETS